MLSKLTDTANILKAKITKDELEEKLVQATTQENWQTPTNLLHEIANAAYNYQKWQKISDFIWDKLKKKPTWRKIVKTLNLVEFLIKNGPPSAISSFKYDIYQFRAFSDFTANQDNIDRGEAIRQKSKQIVQLLSNDEHLEQERQKAKKIRQRMANITGGSNYGGYNNQSYGGGSGSASDGRYESFNNRSYGQKQGGSSYGNTDYTGGGLGVYGDYSYGKSTLDKYKSQSEKKTQGKGAINKPLITPDITGGSDNIQQINKKPFQKIAKKLEKPTVGGTKSVKPQPISPAKTMNKNTNGTTKSPQTDLFDIDVIGQTKTVQVEKPSVSLVQPNLVNPTSTITQNPTNIIPTNLVYNQGYNQPLSQQTLQGQQYPQQYGQPQAFNQPFNQYNPYGQPYPQPYGQTFVQPTQQYGGYQQPFNQPYSQPYTQPYSQPYQNFQPPQPNITLTQPTVTPKTQITLQTKKSSSDQFGSYSSGQSQATSNVKWLSNDQKGLIDFSDFGAQIKGSNSNSNSKKQDKGNNITIDNWAW